MTWSIGTIYIYYKHEQDLDIGLDLDVLVSLDLNLVSNPILDQYKIKTDTDNWHFA